MREIKFRAWDSNGDGMFYKIQDGIEFEDGSHYTFDKFLNPHALDTHQWTVMQYTGLKDKNGKEIYEGDILKIEGATANVVFWERPPEFGLDYYHNEDKWCEDWNLTDDSERMEIIGNIYEQPELLK